MALIRNSFKFLGTKNNPLVYVSIRNHWNKDYKPAPYPDTKEKRLAAIEKYGVMPHQYQPYDNDGNGWGDYPKLPTESADARDPFYPWDFPESKRNYNELIAAEEDIYAEHRYDISYRHRVSLRMQALQTFTVLFVSFSIYAFCEKMKWFLAIAEKQYHKPGEKHYTFELED